MKIGLAQIDCEPGNPNANGKAFSTFAKRAQESGCSTVIFPEMSDTGYTMQAITETAAPWPGPAYHAASAAAKNHSINLVCGLSERTQEGIYNTLAFFDTTGALIGKYRKTHLFSPAKEDITCLRGNAITTVTTNTATWGLSICYDLRFPELFRALALKGASLLLNCSAWPALRPAHWDHLTCARAIENQAFFIAVNRVGTDNGLTMHGHSRIIAPDGRIIAQAGAKEEELLVATLNMQEIAQFRETIPALSSRRNDLYDTLT